MRKVTASFLRSRKGIRKIVSLTAYDAAFARIFDAAGVDLLLVGDTLGMVVQGHGDTLSVTLEDVIYHTRAVRRGTTRALVVADLPFMTYQVSSEQALISAGRLVQEGGAEAVKLEGAGGVVESVARIVGAGIPVVGHLGLTPQSVHALGGFRVQARAESEQQKLLDDARELERAGAFALVLEAVPRDLASAVSRELGIPTIGIGAGPGCDGQVLVCYDLLGLFQGFVPRFVKRYAELGDAVREAVQTYADDVREGRFPDERHSFGGKSRAGLASANEARYASGPKPSSDR